MASKFYKAAEILWRRIIQLPAFTGPASIAMKAHAIVKAATAVSLLVGPSTSLAQANENLASINPELTYLLPYPFEGNLTQDFIDGTSLGNSTVVSTLKSAQSSPFLSFDQEFEDLIGNATLNTLVANTSFPYTWAGEGGIWVPDLNQVWMTSTLYNGPTSLYVLFLENNTVIKPNFTAAPGYGLHLPLAGPAGGYYFNGTIYMALTGDEREPASLVAINPHSYEATPLVNSYFGLEMNPIDDVVVTYTNTSNGPQKHIYFSTLDLAAFKLNVGRGAPMLPNAFWKFTPTTHTLQPVISRADVMTPNGVAVDKDFKHLYVTDTSATVSVGGGAQWNVSGSPAIYRYDLTADGLVTNKSLFGITREGVSDGIKVDDKGRVWTAEYEGIVVRNAVGKVIGIFNKEVILRSKNPPAEMTNFALGGNTLYILANDHILTVNFTETVIAPGQDL
ncbi:hypothetical protein AYL99_08673 [Fonsecaea erecta]|uniref:SMP-30/Gluconolactonase/LRE-like region domain-containing protein n=1 Tax=Fonsecaea erecta TaxID=1367422 RepID=A0A178ZFU9_9EURO|nr:hypothetical protein AYL99_08673 [Fonsecaea erecta]OAP57935.1 hypothetical protein AYL99_08673 [Fonsecaea erecta]